MKFIIGKKLGSSQIFNGAEVVPITVIEAGPCAITQIKTKEKDGYDALQLGFGSKKKLNKPLTGHLKKLGKFSWLREIRAEKIEIKSDDKTEEKEIKELKLGDKIDVGIFKEGDRVKISGLSKSKGFQGVVKRHGFHGAPASHGTKHNLRAPGSIGPTYPERVIKGRKMGGRMGGERVTVKNLKVVKVDSLNNILAIKGAVPGKRGTLLEIKN